MRIFQDDDKLKKIQQIQWQSVASKLAHVIPLEGEFPYIFSQPGRAKHQFNFSLRMRELHHDVD